MQDTNGNCTMFASYERSDELLQHNPLLKKPALVVLRIAQLQSICQRQLLEDIAASELVNQNLFQPITIIVDALIRSGALSEKVLVDGKPYPSGFQGLQTDSSISAESQIEQLVVITKAGLNLLQSYDDKTRLAELLEREPQHKNIYLGILCSCQEQAGRTRFDLEQLINTLASKPASELTPNLANGSNSNPKIYPQYFLDALETAGGIIWKQSWRLTKAGEAVIDLEKASLGCVV